VTKRNSPDRTLTLLAYGAYFDQDGNCQGDHLINRLCLVSTSELVYRNASKEFNWDLDTAKGYQNQ